MTPEEYLKKFENAEILEINTTDFYDYFEEKVWKRYFIPAEEVVVELRYEKEKDELLKRRWNYGAAGDEGDDRIFLRLEGVFKMFPYPLSGNSSGCRTLGHRLFSGDPPKIKEIEDKLTFILHDTSEKRVIGTVEGYDPEKILELEQENFGHAAMTFWKMEIPLEIQDKFKWEKNSPNHHKS